MWISETASECEVNWRFWIDSEFGKEIVNSKLIREKNYELKVNSKWKQVVVEVKTGSGFVFN